MKQRFGSIGYAGRYFELQKFAFFVVVTTVLCLGRALAETESISGTIQSLGPVNDHQFELLIKSENGEAKYIIERSTPIEAKVQASELKEGQKIFLKSSSAIQGMKGMSTPFGNMSSAAKKFLGLPDVPQIPNIPKVPKIPQLPNILKPQGPAQESEQGAPNGAAGQVPMVSGSEPQQTSGEQPKAQPSEDELPPLPKQPVFSGTKVNLSPATADVSEGMTRTVVQLKPTEKGVEVRLAGEAGEKEEVVFAPTDEVSRILAVDDLRTDMRVNLEVSGNANKKVVERVIVI